MGVRKEGRRKKRQRKEKEKRKKRKKKKEKRERVVFPQLVNKSRVNRSIGQSDQLVRDDAAGRRIGDVLLSRTLSLALCQICARNRKRLQRTVRPGFLSFLSVCLLCSCSPVSCPLPPVYSIRTSAQKPNKSVSICNNALFRHPHLCSFKSRQKRAFF